MLFKMHNYKCIFIRVILCGMVIYTLLFSIHSSFTYALDDAAHSYGCFEYVVDSNGITITGFKNNMDIGSLLVIPSVIEGSKVTAIKSNAFRDLYFEGVPSSVQCSDYMSIVKMSSFNWMDSLKHMILGKYTTEFCQHGKADRHGNPIMLKSVKVAEGSEFLKIVDGALYSKDGTILYAWPSLKKRKAIRISSNTKIVYKYAFWHTRLRIIKLQKGITEIQKNAFKACIDVKIKVPKKQYNKYKKMIKKSGVNFGKQNIKLIKY